MKPSTGNAVGTFYGYIKGGDFMLIWIILIILLLAWFGGWKFYPASGNAIHIILVVLVGLLILRLLGLI